MGERRYGGPEGETRHDELRRAWFDGWTEGVMWMWKPEIFGDDVRTGLLRMQPEDGQMNETNTVRLVMKFFTHKEHAESFLDGQMRAGRLHVLRVLEDRVRRDSDEGQFVAKVPKEDGPVWIGTTRLDGIFLVDDDIEPEVGTRRCRRTCSGFEEQSLGVYPPSTIAACCVCHSRPEPICVHSSTATAWVITLWRFTTLGSSWSASEVQQSHADTRCGTGL